MSVYGVTSRQCVREKQLTLENHYEKRNSRSNTGTSAKLGVNCDVLKRYVTHCAHKCGSKFEVSPQVTNLERLFIPIGADASQALSVLLQSSGMDADSKFETVMECEKKKDVDVKDVDRVSTDTKSDVNFAAPSVFLESLKILRDAQEKTIKPRKVVADARSSNSTITSKTESTKDTTTSNTTTSDVRCSRSSSACSSSARSSSARSSRISITSLTSHTNFVARTRRTRTHSHQLTQSFVK